MAALAAALLLTAAVPVGLAGLVGLPGPVGLASAQDGGDGGGLNGTAPARNDVWTVRTLVHADVRHNYATVNVTAFIANRGPDPEFPFEVRVPDDAFVTGLRIVRDGVVHEAEVQPRDQARQAYDAAKAREETAGLVEKQRRSAIYRFLVNVEATESVRATLTYEQYVPAERGVHALHLEAPVSGFGQDLGAAFNVTVRHRDGVAAAWGEPSGYVRERTDGSWLLVRSVGPRSTDAPTPWDVSWSLEATPDAGSLAVHLPDAAHDSVNGTASAGHFVHGFRAPADAATMPLDMALVLDTSGSMSGVKIVQLQDATRQVVDFLGPEDRLDLVPFSSTAAALFGEARPVTPATRDRALAEVDRLAATGSTHIEDAIGTGFASLADAPAASTPGEGPRHRVLVFLTDGRATSGIESEPGLRALARDANTVEATVYGIAFGDDADWGLVHGLAADGDGLAIRVPEGDGAEVDLRRFLTALTTPVLRDVEVEYAEGVHARVQSSPVLYTGSELTIVGTLDPGVDVLECTVTAVGPDGPRTYTLSANVSESDAGPFLPRLVAYHEIRDLQARIDANGPRAEWVDRVTALALEHGFVTDYTSLVVTLAPGDARAEPAPNEPQDEAAEPLSRSADEQIVVDRPAASGGPRDDGSAGSSLGGPAHAPTHAAPAIPGFEGVAVLLAAAAAGLIVGRRRDRDGGDGPASR